MKSIRHTASARDPLLHVETELGIVNVRTNLHDSDGRRVESVEIIPNAYSGEPPIIVDGFRNTRLVELPLEGCGYCATCGYGGEPSDACLHKRTATTRKSRLQSAHDALARMQVMADQLGDQLSPTTNERLMLDDITIAIDKMRTNMRRA